MSLLTDKGQ